MIFLVSNKIYNSQTEIFMDKIVMFKNINNNNYKINNQEANHNNSNKKHHLFLGKKHTPIISTDSLATIHQFTTSINLIVLIQMLMRKRIDFLLLFLLFLLFLSVNIF